MLFAYFSDILIFRKGVNQTETINDRIRILRKALDLTQEEMGEILQVSKSGVSDIECGRRQVRERHIILLKNYNKRDIREKWLRDGTGEMFRTVENKLSEISLGDDEFIKDFLEVYLELDDECKKALKEIMYKMVEKYGRRKE